MNQAYISGIGTAVPTRKILIEETVKIAEKILDYTRPAAVVSKIVSKADIESRFISAPIYGDKQNDRKEWNLEDGMGPSTSERMQLYQEIAPALAIEASRKALLQSKVEASSITHLITVTCTGFFAPGIDLALINNLHLSNSVSRVQVGFLGCHAAINALNVAKAIICSEPKARVLLCAVEICSAHVSFGDQSLVPNLIFSDGAAALVLTDDCNRGEGIKIGSCHSLLIPDSSDIMSWGIGDNGFSMYLSSELPACIERNLKAWMIELLPDTTDANDCCFDRIQWAVHPGGIRVLQAVETALGLSKNNLASSYNILRGFGNMSSPTVIFILENLLLKKVDKPILMLGFGPGLFCEGIFLEVKT